MSMLASGMSEQQAAQHQSAAQFDEPADLHDIGLAQQAVRLHCAVSWPEGLRCNNCLAPHPCFTNRWGEDLLQRAGWSADQIAGLDQRTGPWF